MGLLDRNRPNPSSQGAPTPFSNTPLAGAPPAQAIEPGRLWELLAAAVSAKDGNRLGQLASAHRDVIARSFPEWQKVPVAMRENQSAMQRYANILVVIAQFFRDVFNDPSLLKLLTGDDANNPLSRWQNNLRQADALMGELRFDEARAVLGVALNDIEKIEASGPVSYVAVTQGKIAHCHFHSGDPNAALPHAEKALELSEAKNDEQGTAAALRELYDLQRYLGNQEAAATYADRIAAHAAKNGHAPESERWSKQAQLVRAGEPLCRMTFWVNDLHYEADDLPPLANAKVRYGFMRNRQPLGICQGLVLRGARLAQAGKYEEALAEFRAAAKADPHDPQPHYQRAATLLYLERPADAVQAYEATESLAPGWFYSRADRWLASEIAAGRADLATFMVLRTEEIPESAMSWEKKAAAVEEALARSTTGGAALLHLYHGKCLARQGKTADAQAAFRTGLERAQEPDVRTRLLVELQTVIEDKDEKLRLLREAAELNGNLIAGAVARLASRETAESQAPAQ